MDDEGTLASPRSELDRLRDRPETRVLAVVGPARSGKTAVALEFARARREDVFTVALHGEPRSLFSFVRALVTSLAPIARGAQLSLDAMHDRMGPRQAAAIVAWFASHVSGSAWVVVDGVEMLSGDGAFRELLTEFVARLPQLRWLFCGRSLDALPLERWLATGTMPLPIRLSPVTPWQPADLLRQLDDDERTLLASLAPLRVVEVRLAEMLVGEGGAVLLRRLYERRPLLFEPGNGYCLHRDVAALLLAQLRAARLDVFDEAIARCGAFLEMTQAYDEALRLYARYRARGPLRALMRRAGLLLSDCVSAETLDLVAPLIDDEDDAGSLSVRATVASRRGQHDIAENLYARAVARADDKLAGRIAYAFGCDLLRRGRSDAIALFERLLERRDTIEPHQSEIRSALAQAYVIAGRTASGLEQMKFALHVLDSTAACAPVVRTRAAYVYFYAAHDLALAERFASDALADALAGRRYTVAVGALSILYNVACERDRPSDAIAALELLADCGTKLGNLDFQSYAVIAMLEYSVEARDLAAIARAREMLRSFDIAYESLVSADALVPAEAMQRAWEGEYARAYDLLAPSANRMLGDDFRALREAELAFYAAAAGNRDPHAHLERVEALLSGIDRNTHKALRAMVWLGLARSILGDSASAEAWFASCASAAARFPRLSALRDAARLLHAFWEGADVRADLEATLLRMDAIGLGGFASAFANVNMPLALQRRRYRGMQAI